MPLFEPYTQNLLLEITSKPKRRSKKRLVPSSTLSGGGGSGGSGITGSYAKYSSGWSGTPEAPGTAMPDISIPTQATWGSISQMADPFIDHYIDKYGSTLLSKIPGIGPALGGLAKDPAARFLAKQGAKTILANQYLSGGSGRIGDIPSTIGNAVSSAIFGIKPPASTSGSRFGVLGDKVSGKLVGLAGMGIDPLDWATKAFGAQSALSHMANIGSQTASAAVGAGGYLERGKRKGIF